jgi:hypothetical protein
LANSVGGPEKAGVGGSIPSLATSSNDLQAVLLSLVAFGCTFTALLLLFL